MGKFEEKLTRKVHTTFLYVRLCVSRVFQKKKKEKKHMKSFYYRLPVVEKCLEKCLKMYFCNEGIWIWMEDKGIR